MSFPTYEEHWYADSRLSGTIVLTKDGTPIRIDEVLPDNRLSYEPLVKKGDSGPLTLDDIETQVPKLGYINAEAGALYFCRRPSRHYKQGLNHKNTSLISPSGKVKICPSTVGYSYIEDCFMNRYPSLEYCLDLIRGKDLALSQAFHKDFAVVKVGDSVTIQFKTLTVGVLVEEKGSVSPILREEFEWVRQDLESALYGK